MNKILRIILACITSCFFLCACEPSTPQPSIIEEEKEEPVFAMWFAFLDYEEVLQNKSEEEFKTSVEEIVTNLDDLGINTIYLHAVPFMDALYDSKILPRSNSLPGIEYDPLRIFIESAHNHNMKLEAWVNPLRAFKIEEADSYLDSSILKEWYRYNDERLRPVGERYYLNPAYPEVREFVCSIVQEILDNYDVDGIHLDDYFYPDNTPIYFDAYLYGEENYKNPLSLSEFRLNAINELVKEIHDVVKAKDEELTFGISVAGNYSVDVEMYYADPVVWKERNLIDYLIPQVYWGFDHPTMPYTSTLDSWKNMMNDSNVRVYSGIAAYKIGTEDYYAENSTEWIDHTDMLERQTNTAFDLGCPGIALFRYTFLFHPSEETKGNVEKEIINIKNAISLHESLSE